MIDRGYGGLPVICGGNDLSGLERVDCPANANGHSYTEFRDRAGAVVYITLTRLAGKVPLRVVA